MMHPIRRIVFCLMAAMAFSSCSPAEPHTATAAGPGAVAPPPPPAAPREFRAAWIASVGNSNWPRADRSSAEQQQDMIALLDRCVALNLNAVVLQIRPGADALYKSDLEPWSEYLTGVQGRAPSPYYDPLQMWVTEAHRRGLELHAWYNAYRVSPARRGNFAPNSIAKTHPEIVRKYGNSLWMDPGEPLAAQHTLAVIMDIVRRYDIDGIHTDDYYYPYRVKDKATSKPVDFPDAPSYQRYQQAGGKLARDDWRRNNINQLIEQIYSGTKQLKPWVKVGFSPFGIWKEGHPPGIKGISQTDELYSDPKLWLNRGWLDYLAPQLYWHIGGDQDFKSLLTWWLAQNTHHRHVWPGLSLSKNGDQEILDQIEFIRKHDDPGEIFWSINGLFHGREKGDMGPALINGPFAQRALVPASPWLDHTPPLSPVASIQQNAQHAAIVNLRPGAGKPTWVYAIYIRYGDSWRFTTLPGGAPSITVNPDAKSGPASAIVVSAVDRTGNESPRIMLTIQ